MKLKKIRGIQRENFLLAILKQFQMRGKKETSLTEILESAQKLDEKITLDYDFHDKLLYSSAMFHDLDELIFKGYIHEIVYRHDSFLPKRYVTLTGVGNLEGKQILQNLSEETKKDLYDSVNFAMQNYVQRWRYWSRPLYNP